MRRSRCRQRLRTLAVPTHTCQPQPAPRALCSSHLQAWKWQRFRTIYTGLKRFLDLQVVYSPGTMRMVNGVSTNVGGMVATEPLPGAATAECQIKLFAKDGALAAVQQGAAVGAARRRQGQPALHPPPHLTLHPLPTIAHRPLHREAAAPGAPHLPVQRKPRGGDVPLQP